MALTRMPRKGERIRNPGAPGSLWPTTLLVVDHVTPRGIVVCTYADGRLAHGVPASTYADGRLAHGVPATTSFIGRFGDGTFNQHMEHVEGDTP